MSKPLLGLLLGGLLGVFDGLSAAVSAPETRPEIVGIVVGSTFKGLLVGVLAGAFARKVDSLPLGIAFGLVVGAALAALVVWGQLAEGRAGAALLAMRTGVPVLPVGVSGTQHIFRGRRLIPRRSKVTIRIGPPFSLPVRADGLDRAALREGTETVMRAIAAQLPPEQRGRWSR